MRLDRMEILCLPLRGVCHIFSPRDGLKKKKEKIEARGRHLGQRIPPQEKTKQMS